MAYSDFTLEMVVERFSLALGQESLFPNVSPLAVPPSLEARLGEGRPYALRSEKARSEFIIVPILLAMVPLSGNRLSIYSGQRFDVDPATGLSGECDFILSASDPVPIVRAPVISVIEAKKADIEQGYGQCAAQVLASLRFNQQHGILPPLAYGCVTTGEQWQFLRLEGNLLTFDTTMYYWNDLGRILACFLDICRQMGLSVP